MLVFGEGSDFIPCATQRHTKVVLRNYSEEEDIIVVLWLLVNCSQKKRIVVRRSTALKKAKTSKPRKQEKNEAAELSKGKKIFDDKQAILLPGRVKQQALLNKKVSSEIMRKERIPVPYWDRILELQFSFELASVKAFMILKDHRTSVHFDDGRCNVLLKCSCCVYDYFRVLVALS